MVSQTPTCPSNSYRLLPRPPCPIQHTRGYRVPTCLLNYAGYKGFRVSIPESQVLTRSLARNSECRGVECSCRGDRGRRRKQQTGVNSQWFRFCLSVASRVTLGRSPHLSVPWFPVRNIAFMTAATSSACCEAQVS